MAQSDYGHLSIRLGSWCSWKSTYSIAICSINKITGRELDLKLNLKFLWMQCYYIYTHILCLYHTVCESLLLFLFFLQRRRKQINVSIWWRVNCAVCCKFMDFSKLSLLPWVASHSVTIFIDWCIYVDYMHVVCIDGIHLPCRDAWLWLWEKWVLGCPLCAASFLFSMCMDRQ